jgi:hypothetical protein
MARVKTMETGKIEIEIEGLSPLLMNSPKGLYESSGKGRKKTDIPSHEESAERSAYRNKKGELYIPSYAVENCLIKSASGYKWGKKPLNSLLAGAIRVNPEEILLGTKEYEIDLRKVTVQRQGVIRARAKIPKWSVKFEIIYYKKYLPAPLIEMLSEVMEEAGIRVGLLDFRPACKGNFGTFRVKKFKVVE